MPLASATLLCLVVAISDGDTLRARCGRPGAYEQVTVRVHAIDAPERSQPHGQRARQELSKLVFRKTVGLECVDTDRYSRQVCRVMVAPDDAPEGPRSVDAGLTLIGSGLAWWYRAYSKAQTPRARGLYERAEQEARQRRLGLWRDRDAMPPWQWRREHARVD